MNWGKPIRLGEAYNALHDYPKALEYHVNSLTISHKIKFLPSISNSLQNTGFTYYLMHDSGDKALEYVRQAMKINRISAIIRRWLTIIFFPEKFTW